MKRIGMIVIALVGLASMPAHAIRHSLTNGSDKTIDVFMYLHGESMLGTNAENCLNSIWTSCCRREKRGLKPGEWVEWDTKGCQLRRVRVVEQETGKEFSVNVRNASLSEVMRVGKIAGGIFIVSRATALAGGVVGSVLPPGLSVIGGTIAAFGAASITGTLTAVTAAKDVYELVAYGSTGWLYNGFALGAVNGVAVYMK